MQHIKQAKKILIITFSVLIVILVFYGGKSLANRLNLNKVINTYRTNRTNLVKEKVSGANSKVVNEQVNQEEENPEIYLDSGQQNQETDLEIIKKKEPEIDYTPHPEIKIRIIKKPHSEEPDWVKEAWVGLEIPVIKGRYEQKGGQEVLSGNFRQEDNYVVPVEETLSLLKQKNPAAEKWWRDNVALEEVHGIGFNRDFCELIRE